MMASTAFTKHTGCTGILCFLLLGILLPSVLISGQTTYGPPSTLSTDDSPVSTADLNTTTKATANTATTAMAQSPTTAISDSTAANTTTQSPTSTISASNATTTSSQPSTSAISASTAANITTQSPTSTISASTSSKTSTATSTTTTSNQFSTTTTSSRSSTTVPTTTVDADGSAAITSSADPVDSVSPGSDSSTAMTSTNDTSGMNGTTPSNSSSMSMIYCRSFTCNYSDCYTMYTSQNGTSCTDGYCQLTRMADMCYTVGCSLSCIDKCVNATHINCSVNCCKSTGCLRDNFKAMMINTTTVTATSKMTTTTPVTTTAATSPTTTTTTATTTADKTNKCHYGTCTGTDCYKNSLNQQLQACSSSQIHCQLKKETVDSKLQWTAGCTTNCSGQTPCKTSTQPPCHLECCNATMTSCLWLNGTLNVPSFATRGPHLNTELIASLLCLLAITLLL